MSDYIMDSKKRRYWRINREKLFALVKPLKTEIPPLGLFSLCNSEGWLFVTLEGQNS